MPRDGSDTRGRVLEVAEGLVIENGFAATSVEQVIAASGSSKGAFFHHFPSKRALAGALVERYVAADLAYLEHALAVADRAGEPAARVVAFLRVFEDGAEELVGAQSGCLYAALLAERRLGEVTQPQVAAAVVAWRDAFAALVRAAYAGRRRPPGIDPDALADHVFVTFEGAFLLCRATGEPSHMRSQLRVLRQLVEGLLAR